MKIYNTPIVEVNQLNFADPLTLSVGIAGKGFDDENEDMVIVF